MATIEQTRASDAKAKYLYYTGQSNTHPHGESGKRWLLVPEDDKRCRDTSVAGYSLSEWGNAAGAQVKTPIIAKGSVWMDVNTGNSVTFLSDICAGECIISSMVLVNGKHIKGSLPNWIVERVFPKQYNLRPWDDRQG